MERKTLADIAQAVSVIVGSERVLSIWSSEQWNCVLFLLIPSVNHYISDIPGTKARRSGATVFVLRIGWLMLRHRGSEKFLGLRGAHSSRRLLRKTVGGSCEIGDLHARPQAAPESSEGTLEGGRIYHHCQGSMLYLERVLSFRTVMITEKSVQVRGTCFSVLKCSYVSMRASFSFDASVIMCHL